MKIYQTLAGRAVWAAGCLLALFTACNDGKEDNLTASQVYIVNSGLQAVTIYNVSEPYTYQFAVYKAGAFPGAATLKAAVMTDSELSAYNTEQGTDYRLLPASYYQIEEELNFEFTGAKDDVNRYARIVFDTGKFQALIDEQPDETFVLPIRITTASVAVNEEKAVCLLRPEIKIPLLDRANWKIVDKNTEETVGEGETNGRASCLLDGNTGTFWHSQWKDISPKPALPHYAVIDMGQTYTITQINLIRRHDNRDAKGGEFAGSTDNQTWTKIGEFELANTDDTQLFPVTVSTGRYLKVIITQSNHGESCTSLAEVMVHGY